MQQERENVCQTSFFFIHFQNEAFPKCGQAGQLVVIGFPTHLEFRFGLEKRESHNHTRPMMVHHLDWARLSPSIDKPMVINYHKYTKSYLV